MKRFSMTPVTRCGQTFDELQEDPDGEYVSFEEHEALRGKLAAMHEVAQRAEMRVTLYPGLKGSTYYAAYLEMLALLVRDAAHDPISSEGGKKP